MKLSISHTTEYTFDQPVEYALQKVRLRPMSNTTQQVKDWSVSIEGGKFEVGYQDHYGNLVDLVSATEGTQKLTATAIGEVETLNNTGVLGMVFGRMPLWHFQSTTPQTEPGAKSRAFARVIGQGGSVLQGLHDASAAILEAVPYEAGQTKTNTTAEEAIKIGKGVCQDHAHILIAAAREAGLPARYVSGYLMMNDRVDQDASHAWADVYINDLGWVGFDVSNGVSPDERYVRIAIGRDGKDAAPISGLRLGNADETMIVSLQVQQ
ncbi:MAG: transglutaminase family protein [Silicimonas sp.]|nr:transglutaminase family protein [Silicimonas sp.]